MKNILRLTLFLALFFPALAGAADAVLVRASGEVQVRLKGSKVYGKAASGAQLKFGDWVQTLKRAKAHILFANGSAILIKESTTVKLNGQLGKIYLNIPKGEFLIGVRKKLARGQSFRVRTPSAVAAVRGTLFWGLSDDNLNSTYASFKDSIQITAQGKSILLSPGEKSFIPYGKAPGKKEPSGISPDFMDTFQVEGTIEDLKDLIK